MTTIEKMIADREKIRSTEAELTKQIAIERKKIREAKKSDFVPSSRGVDEFKKLQSENSELKRLLAIMHKDKGVTYKNIGEIIGISAARARQLVEKQIRIIRQQDWSNRDES